MWWSQQQLKVDITVNFQFGLCKSCLQSLLTLEIMPLLLLCVLFYCCAIGLGSIFSNTPFTVIMQNGTTVKNTVSCAFFTKSLFSLVCCAPACGKLLTVTQLSVCDFARGLMFRYSAAEVQQQLFTCFPTARSDKSMYVTGLLLPSRTANCQNSIQYWRAHCQQCPVFIRLSL